MSATDRLRTEMAFHDRQAQDRRPDLRDLRFEDADYLDHETWVRPAFDRLGDVVGLDVLDFGCGHGMASVVLARHGARVTAFDLSAGYVAEARDRAAANDVRVRFLQADGDRLPFADGSFDRVWGSAILHHLHLPVAAVELKRVLRPGGVAVFCEPWGENPLLNWARQSLSYPGKGRTPDETPLHRGHVRELTAVFGTVDLRGYQLLSMVRRVAPRSRLLPWLEACDDRLLRFSGLQRFCRYVVLTLRN